MDLYMTSRLHEKKNIDSDSYWYERSKEELTFRPKINKVLARQEEAPQINEIKGTEKQLERFAKAREENAWKKMMTERSTFSATKGIKNARKNVNKVQEDHDFYTPPVESKKFQSGFGGVDGSQIIPLKNQSIIENLSRERPPLYLPKQSSQVKPKATMPIIKKPSPPPVAPQVPQ